MEAGRYRGALPSLRHGNSRWKCSPVPACISRSCLVTVIQPYKAADKYLANSGAGNLADEFCSGCEVGAVWRDVRLNELPCLSEGERPSTPRRPASRQILPNRPSVQALFKRIFFRCSNNSEIAAGVIPGMRDACATVSGRTSLSFWRTSFDKPRTWS